MKRAKLVVTRVTPTTMKRDGEGLEPGALGGEGVVAEPDSGHRLDREVERDQEVEMGVGRRVRRNRDG